MAEQINSTTAFVGWVPQPNGRGTYDILLSCAVTIFLCCWTSVCVNIPAARESKLERLWDKLRLALLGILGPDFLLILAVGQWESAQYSVKLFEENGFAGWTKRHAFFADMGGFLVQIRDRTDPVPLTAEQLLFFIRRKRVAFPPCDKTYIDDKNKHDGLARSLTIIQAIGFALRCFGRFRTKNALTTLELTTLSFIIAMVFTSAFWRQKPQDVAFGLIIAEDVSMEEYFESVQAYDNPHRNVWLIGVAWRFFNHLLLCIIQSMRDWMCRVRSARSEIIARRTTTSSSYSSTTPFSLPSSTYYYYHPSSLSKASDLPLRVPSDDFPTFSLNADFYCGAIMILYSATFLISWRFAFPSLVETYFWRVASLVILAYTFPCGFVLLWLEYRYFDDWKRHRRHLLGRRCSLGETDLLERVIEMTCRILHISTNPSSSTGTNNASPTPMQEAREDGTQPPWNALIPRWALAYCTGMCAVYCCARGYILLEDVIAFRHQPAAVYADIPGWTRYLPGF